MVPREVVGGLLIDFPLKNGGSHAVTAARASMHTRCAKAQSDGAQRALLHHPRAGRRRQRRPQPCRGACGRGRLNHQPGTDKVLVRIKEKIVLHLH